MDQSTTQANIIGATLGHYRVLDLIGSGGMGSVYLAEHLTLGRKVAIKMLHPELARDASLAKRFFVEALAVNKISNDNIVQVIDFGDEGDAKYFVMELLDGQALEQDLEAGAIPLRRALELAIQICSALASAHAAGIVHRDLKPANIFIVERDGKDFVKLVDFGIAKILEDDSRRDVAETSALAILGTPQFMAPEQLNSDAVGPHTDIYTFGLVLFHMLVGRPPFNGDNIGELLLQHATAPAPKLRDSADLPQWVPTSLDALVAQCLAKNPKDRPESATVVGERLTKILESLPKDWQSRTPVRTSRLWLATIPAIMVIGLTTLGYTRGMGPWSPAESEVKSAESTEKAPARASGVRVVFASSPAGADVVQMPEQVSLGKTPFIHTFAKGPKTVAVELRLAGYVTRKQVVSLDKDADLRVVLEEPRSASKPSAQRSLSQKARKADAHPEKSSVKLTKDGVVNPF